MKKRHFLFGLFLITLLFSGCNSKLRKVKNLETFAKVYGYVRWFYPSDEAAKIDWTSFAVYGVSKVENARSQNQLKKELLNLFKPIAPALQIENAFQSPGFDLKSIVPSDTSGFKPVTWIHYGVYLGEKSNIYQSKRTNRQTPSTQLKNYSMKELVLTSSHSPKIGDYITKNIGSDLVCIMPLVLYGTSKQTYPIPDTVSTRKLNNEIQHVHNLSLNIKNSAAKLANTVITWNVFQHFYPYFDVVHVDWGKELEISLQDVLNSRSEADYFKCISRMIAKLEDGHGVVSCNNIDQWGFPVSFAYIENKVVISGSNSSLFKRGDIIESIDGRSAIEELISQESLISGSPQLKRYRALNMFGSDFSQSKAHIILSRDGKTLKIKADRTLRCNLFSNILKAENFQSLDYGDGIYYVICHSYEFENELNNLIKAKGIVISSLFDISEIIPHLIKESVWSPIWNIPITTYPDRVNVVFDTSQWKFDPLKPLISAKLAFIVEPFRVSSGETFLSFIDYYKLGKLVGDTSAGTNGNVNFIELMGDYSIMWTGMKVLKQDGSQHHLIGYRPDFPVKRTIKAIKENRNEYLDKALEILKN
jgi:hypothetical protein